MSSRAWFVSSRASRPRLRDAAPGPGDNAPVGLYRDEAIVLRTQKLGEADRIITLLTRSSGRVRAVAKGVRRTTSRFGSRLEPFTHVDLQLAEGRSLDIVTQAETLDPFAGRLGCELRAVHRRHGDARDRRAAGHRGQGAGPPAVPAAGRGAARDVRHRPSPAPGARLVPAAVPGRRGVRPHVRGLRPVRPDGRAPLVQPGGRRDALLDLPRARGDEPVTGGRRTPRGAAGRGLAGDRGERGRHRKEATGMVAAYLSGTSSAGSSRSRTSTADLIAARDAVDLHRLGAGLHDRPRR